MIPEDNLEQFLGRILGEISYGGITGRIAGGLPEKKNTSRNVWSDLCGIPREIPIEILMKSLNEFLEKSQEKSQKRLLEEDIFRKIPREVLE